jgi:hypothetical protein
VNSVMVVIVTNILCCCHSLMWRQRRCKLCQLFCFSNGIFIVEWQHLLCSKTIVASIHKYHRLICAVFPHACQKVWNWSDSRFHLFLILIEGKQV